MEKKRGLHQYLSYFKRKKEARMTLIYSVSYFVFITLLFVFGSVARAQTPAKSPQKQIEPATQERTTTDVAVDSW